MLRVVIDANVWISGLLVSGHPREIISQFESGRFLVVYPEWLFVELRKTQEKPRLAARILQYDLENLVASIESIGIMVEPPGDLRISRDPKDDVYLHCAAEAHCDYVITGDQDLLVLERYKDTQIVTPAQFIEIISSREGTSE